MKGLFSIELFEVDGGYCWDIVSIRAGQRKWNTYAPFPTLESALADAKAYLDHVVLKKPYRMNFAAFGIIVKNDNPQGVGLLDGAMPWPSAARRVTEKYGSVPPVNIKSQ